MKKPTDSDLTTGSIGSHFRKLAVPAAFGMLFATLYNVVDTYFAGMIGTQAQAGLAVGYQAFFIMMAIGFGLGSALSTLVSNAKGRKSGSDATRLAAQGIAYGICATLTLMVAGFFGGPYLIELVSEPGDYRQAALGYFRWLIMALPGFLMAYGLNGILQAHGDTVTMQRALMVAFFANIGLNPLFIFGIPGVWGGMGFNGIALATILSQTGVMAFVAWRVSQLEIMVSVTRPDFRPTLTSFSEITGQLLPTATAMMVMFVSGFVVQFALKGFGGHAIAAYGVALRIEQILLLPVLGMTGALLPIAAQNFGAEAFDRVRGALYFCWKLGFAMSVIAMPSLWFGAELAMALFTDDADVIAVGASYLRVDAFLFPIYMMLFAINSFIQALKQPIWTLWISIYRQGFGVAFFVWLLVAVFGFDVTGVWLGIAAAVTSGWLIALGVTQHLARVHLGGLWQKQATTA